MTAPQGAKHDIRNPNIYVSFNLCDATVDARTPANHLGCITPFK